jgi:hypothetical protein
MKHDPVEHCKVSLQCETCQRITGEYLECITYSSESVCQLLTNEQDQQQCILLSITNKMQRCTIFFIAVNALHVSGSFSAHHQELKTVHTASGICQACLLLPLALLMMGGETA